jgi:hypothetical protein
MGVMATHILHVSMHYIIKYEVSTVLHFMEGNSPGGDVTCRIETGYDCKEPNPPGFCKNAYLPKMKFLYRRVYHAELKVQ